MIHPISTVSEAERIVVRYRIQSYRTRPHGEVEMLHRRAPLRT